MNRRFFLAGLGAAVAAVAITTRLGETKLLAPPKYENLYLSGTNKRFITDEELEEGMPWQVGKQMHHCPFTSLNIEWLPS